MTNKENDRSEDIIDVEVISSASPNKSANSSAQSAGRVKKMVVGLLWLLLILLLAAGSAAAYWGWLQLATYQTQSSALVSQVQQLQQRQAGIAEATQKVAAAEAQDQERLNTLQEQLQSVGQRLDSQNKRLLSMSTTSKEDWKLLEARYLLRLANQRLLTERDSVGSVAQLQAADNILRDLDDAELFPIRKAIAADIAALKLAPNIDRDGVYLRLISLADNIKQLPAIKPLPTSILESQLRPEVASADGDILVVERTHNGLPPTYWMQFKGWSQRLFAKLSEHVRVRHHDSDIKVLAPEMRHYITQNVRLNLEQAQLALLGEKQDIYHQSLQEAQKLLLDYYQLNDQVGMFIDEFESLKNLDIRRSLPSISDSLAQLDAYIQRLHNLQSKAQAVPVVRPKISAEQGAQ